MEGSQSASILTATLRIFPRTASTLFTVFLLRLASDHDPKRAVDRPEPRPRSCATKNRKLLAEHEILRNEARTRPQRGAQRADNGLHDREHRGEFRAGRSPCHPRIAPADAVCQGVGPACGASEGILRKCIFVTTGEVFE
jgi:hypothetical protein